MLQGAAGDWVDEFARGVADLKLGEGLDGATAAEMEAAWRAQEAAAWAEEFNKVRLREQGLIRNGIQSISPLPTGPVGLRCSFCRRRCGHCVLVR